MNLPKEEWSYWDPKEDKIKFISKYHSISICTTCMNRTHDLERTLPLNILNNIHYPHFRVVLLNYNSADYMDEWVKKHLMVYIKRGIVKYAKTIEPKYFHMGHSRNIAFKLAETDIVNNVDADNYIGNGFITTINYLANIQREKAIFAKGRRLMHGRIGFYKDEFMALGGYDESMTGYGADDRDLVERAQASGYKMMWWNDLGDFMNRIKTPKSEVDKYMEEKWSVTEKRNKEIAAKNLSEGKLIANQGEVWGKARLLINFEEEIEI